MTSPKPVSWGYFVLALPMSLSIYWGVTELFALSIETCLFLPILTGWLASRQGPGVVGLLLALGVLTVFQIRIDAFDYAELTLGVPLYVYLLAVCSAIAFAQPRFASPRAPLFLDRWRWLKWLLVPALGIAISSAWRPVWEVDDRFLVGANILILPVAFLAAAIDWKELHSYIERNRQTNEPRWRRMAKFFWAGLFAMGFVLAASVQIGDVLEVSFANWSVMPLLIALAFVLPALGMVDWKLTIVFMIAIFAVDWLVYWAADAIRTALEAEAARSAAAQAGSGDEDVLVGQIVVTGSPIVRGNLHQANLIAAVCATLLAVALAPFWRARDASLVQCQRSAIFVFLSFALLLAGTAFFLGDFLPVILGGIAFGMGLIWQVRGVLGAPLIIMIGYLLALVLTQQGYYATTEVYRVVNIGLIAFPFAYFGLLSNRFSPRVARP